MSSDSLCLLGTFQLIHHGQPLILGQPRLEELLALLALRPGVPVARTQLAYHFWPDSSERQARTNARNLLFKLKQLWPQVDEVIEIGRTEVTWRGDAAVVLDSQSFLDYCNKADEAVPAAERVPLLVEAVASYGGELLPSSYAEWVLTEREQLRLRFVAALEALIDGLLALRRYDEALQRATQLRDHDPLHEASYRLMMQIHSLLGDRVAALRVYHACVSMLEKELGVEPSPATSRLHAQLVQRSPTTDKATAPAVNQRPRLIGRHAEWQQLQQIWRTVQTGNAHAVIIWGEAGIGKTRLAEELLDWVQRLGHVAASSRSYAAQGALSYAPITEWLRAPTVQPALSAIDDLYRVEVARLLPELLTDRPDLPAPGPLTETWQQQRFLQSIAHALAAVAGPLLLHLDDMQWSDQETLVLLQFLLHSSRREPLLILGTVRTEDAVENQPLHDLVAALRHQTQLTEVTLAPLSQTEVTELAQQTAGAAISSDTAQELYAASEGHPLFLIETVRSDLTARSSGLREPTNRAALATDHGLTAIPPKIYSLFVARLGQLSATAQQVASIAAVIGRAFTYPVLQAATTLDESNLVDALDELWTRRIIREQGGDRYDFSHDRIREVAYQEISRARRRLFHRQVAEALTAIHGNGLDDIAGELAAHYAQAGDSEQAYRYYWQAAHVALTQYALGQAALMFDAALAHASTDPTKRLHVLHEQNRIYRSSSQFRRWQENLDEIERLWPLLPTPEQHLRVELALDRCAYFAATGQGHEAVAIAQSAIDVAEALGDPNKLARSYQALGQAYWSLARMSDAGKAYQAASDYARAGDDPLIEGQLHDMAAQTGMFVGMPADEMFAHLSQAFAIAQRLDNKRLMTELYSKFGYWRVTLGMGGFDEAEQNYRRSLELGKAIGEHLRQDIAMSNLVVLFTNKGDYRQAINTFDTASQIISTDPRYWRYCVTRFYFAATMMQIGCLDRARLELSQASEQLRLLGHRHFEVKARAELGLLYHLAGENQQAAEELHQVLALIANHGDLRFEAFVRTRLGYALEASGQLDAACQQYAQGRTLHDQMSQHYYAMNALAGSARVAMRQGDSAIALALAQTVWQTIGGQETDATVETARTLRTCYEIFQQQGEPQAVEVLDTAVAQLRRRAASIDDPEYLAQFWQLADHRFFQEVAGDRLSVTSDC
ncbi:MAG TPA: BTAD domain-containing putative transcriptional regulator [Caldilineaceae bacterium]|nr:BTAD domain-containing putative transcriptional regulator [Caldilineaceae bacterium]